MKQNWCFSVDVLQSWSTILWLLPFSQAEGTAQGMPFCVWQRDYLPSSSIFNTLYRWLVPPLPWVCAWRGSRLGYKGRFSTRRNLYLTTYFFLNEMQQLVWSWHLGISVPRTSMVTTWTNNGTSNRLRMYSSICESFILLKISAPMQTVSIVRVIYSVSVKTLTHTL